MHRTSCSSRCSWASKVRAKHTDAIQKVASQQGPPAFRTPEESRSTSIVESLLMSSIASLHEVSLLNREQEKWYISTEINETWSENTQLVEISDSTNRAGPLYSQRLVAPRLISSLSLSLSIFWALISDGLKSISPYLSLVHSSLASAPQLCESQIVLSKGPILQDWISIDCLGL